LRAIGRMRVLRRCQKHSRDGNQDEKMCHEAMLNPGTVPGSSGYA
jgi:hypothetical protein